MRQTKANELIGTSTESFEGAMQAVLRRANRTLRGVRCLDVLAREIDVGGDGVLLYRVRVLLRFDVTPPDNLHW